MFIKIMNKLYVAILIIISFHAYSDTDLITAYIDPGSGSAITAAILAFFSGLYFYAKKYFFAIKKFFTNIFSKKK